MPISISGSGTITGISAGGLPDGCVTTDDLANAAVTGTKLAAGAGGKILQVVQAIKLDTFSSSSTTGEDITGLSVTITPSSITSKILVMTDVKASGASEGGGVLLLRGSTVIYQGDGSGSRRQYSHFVYGQGAQGIYFSPISMSLNYLDSPASVSALTYKLQAKVNAAAPAVPFCINRSAYDAGSYNPSLPSSIIVMEVAA